MIQAKDAEIMAPVGSFESLAAAINAGCDSIYFGVTQLNMRARAAANLTLADLAEIMTVCHKNNVKAYLAVNTLLYDHDVMIMRKIVDAAKVNGVDAIIAFDFATIQYCNEIGIPSHVSVQFSVSNYESLKFFTGLTNRVVLARELTLDQIKDIHHKILEEQLMGNEGRLMEIEAFIHGALCVAQSGRCFMSLHTHNASANRGACNQNCRAKYKVTDVDTGKELIVDNQYVMSAADICTIDFLDKLLESGVQVMKIEGRGRSAEYVSTVVRVYKQALRDIENREYTKERIEGYYRKLKTVYNRGLSKGNYYLGKELGEYSDVYGSKATKEKECVGRVKHYFGKIGVAEVEMSAGELFEGDDILIMGTTTGVYEGKVIGLRADDQTSIKTGKKGDVITFTVTDKVRENDNVYLFKDRKNERE
jgi:putative protease